MATDGFQGFVMVPHEGTCRPESFYPSPIPVILE